MKFFLKNIFKTSPRNETNQWSFDVQTDNWMCLSGSYCTFICQRKKMKPDGKTNHVKPFLSSIKDH